MFPCKKKLSGIRLLVLCWCSYAEVAATSSFLERSGLCDGSGTDDVLDERHVALVAKWSNVHVWRPLFETEKLQREGRRPDAGSERERGGTSGGRGAQQPIACESSFSSLLSLNVHQDRSSSTDSLSSQLSNKKGQFQQQQPAWPPATLISNAANTSENLRKKYFQLLLFFLSMKIGHSCTNQLWKYELLSKWKMENNATSSLHERPSTQQQKSLTLWLYING